MASRDTDLKQDLLQAAQAAVATTSAPEGLPPRGTAPAGTRWGLVWTGVAILAALTGYVLGTQPEWAFPNRGLAESPEVTAASMRLSLVRERQRVETFRQRNGRLPATLAEAGGVATNIELVVEPGDTYVLRAVENGAALELRSTEALDAFLGNSLQLILNRRNEP